MTKLSEDAVRSYSNLASNAQASTSFDPIISYTQIFQNYTQSQLDHGRPDFTIILDGETHHEPTHSGYRGLSLVPKEKAELLSLLET